MFHHAFGSPPSNRTSGRPFIRQREDLLQQLYFGDGLLGVHFEILMPSGDSRILTTGRR